MVRVWAFAVTILALALAGCGTLHAAAGVVGGQGVSGRPTATYWATFGLSGSQIVSVRREDSGRVLAMAVQLPSGSNGCTRDLTARLTGFNSTMAYIEITFQGLSTVSFGSHCALTQVRTTRVTLPAPLGKRDIIIDQSGTFAPTSGTLMRRCSDLGGACTFPPVPLASCSESSYSAAMFATDPPQGADSTAVGCDGHWLVLDVGWPGGPSGCDGPSCSQSSTVTHWFFHAGPHGWIVITNSLTAGCTRVHQVAPQFPTALCTRLPAVGPYASTS